MAWVLDTGTRGKVGRPIMVSPRSRLWDAKTKSTRDMEKTAMRALMGVSLKIPLPTVDITRRE